MILPSAWKMKSHKEESSSGILWWVLETFKELWMHPLGFFGEPLGGLSLASFKQKGDMWLCGFFDGFSMVLELGSWETGKLVIW